MTSIRFGLVTGEYKMSRDKARETLTRIAEEVSRNTQASIYVHMTDKGDQIRVGGTQAAKNLRGTVVDDLSKSFTAQGHSRSIHKTQRAEQLFSMLAAKQGFAIDA